MHIFFSGKSDETFVLPIQFFLRIDESESGLQIYAAAMHVSNVRYHSAKVILSKNYIVFKLMDPASYLSHLYPEHVKRALSTPLAPLPLDDYCFTFDGMYRRGWDTSAYTVRTFYQIRMPWYYNN